MIRLNALAAAVLLGGCEVLRPLDEAIDHREARERQELETRFEHERDVIAEALRAQPIYIVITTPAPATPCECRCGRQ